MPHITAHIEDVLASAGRSEATPAPLLLLDLPRLMYCIGIGRDTIAVGRARLFEFKSSTLSFMPRAAAASCELRAVPATEDRVSVPTRFDSWSMGPIGGTTARRTASPVCVYRPRRASLLEMCCVDGLPWEVCTLHV